MAVVWKIRNNVQKDLTFLKKHERLILGVLLLSVVLFIGNKVVNYLDNRDARNAAVSAQILEAQKQQNVVLAAQAAKDRSDYQNTVATLTAANTALQQGILKLEANWQPKRRPTRLCLCQIWLIAGRC